MGATILFFLFAGRICSRIINPIGAKRGSAEVQLSITKVWTSPKRRAQAGQALLSAAILLFCYLAYGNMNQNMADRGLIFGFDYLARPSGFAIGETPIPYSATSTFGRALLVGILSTLRVSIIGIVLATFWGFLFGIGRLSRNPLLKGIIGFYIEVIRNTPLILQLVLWYALLNSLPQPRNAITLGLGVHVSNHGLTLPWLDWTSGLGIIALTIGVGTFAIIPVAHCLKKLHEKTGIARPLWPFVIILITVPALCAAVTQGQSIIPSIPKLDGFDFSGGIVLTPEFSALLFGLVIYISAYIAEIVRGGILAVSHGQWEAGRSLGLTDRQVLRLIVLPQALRVIIPPLTSEYLNLTKDSSLAVIIGYPDLVHVSNTTMNLTGRAVEAILIFASVYLTISLATSAFMNWSNARAAIKER